MSPDGERENGKDKEERAESRVGMCDEVCRGDKGCGREGIGGEKEKRGRVGFVWL